MNLAFCNEDHRYEGGQTMECRWRIHLPAARVASALSVDSEPPVTEDLKPPAIQCVEASVMWYTEGKGDEDFNVHYFQRFGPAEIATMDWSCEHMLKTTLPVSPLSYEGNLLRIRWCVRLRLFLSSGNEIVAQHPFWLTATPLGG